MSDNDKELEVTIRQAFDDALNQLAVGKLSKELSSQISEADWEFVEDIYEIHSHVYDSHAASNEASNHTPDTLRKLFNQAANTAVLFCRSKEVDTPVGKIMIVPSVLDITFEEDESLSVRYTRKIFKRRC